MLNCFKKYGALLLVVSTLSLAAPSAHATLKNGDIAPDFKTQASMGGNEFSFSLAEALKKGPVVLYFYPAAFTSGCTAEAHAFAEATDQFKAMGATVIGVSHDNIKTLKKFSVSECRSKFAVASDADGAITKSYDAAMLPLMKMSSRTSYVILPDDTVLYVYSAMNPEQHVTNTLNALKEWHSSQADIHKAKPE